MRARGLNFQTQVPDPDELTQPESVSDTTSDEAGESESKQEPPAPQEAPEPKPKAQTSKPSKSAAKAPKAKESGDVPASVQRQLNRLAAQRGIEPPEVSTKAEAKEALKKLRETSAQG